VDVPFASSGEWALSNPAIFHIARVPWRPTFDTFAMPATFLTCCGSLHFSDPGKSLDPGMFLQIPPNCIGDITRRLAAQQCHVEECDRVWEARAGGNLAPSGTRLLKVFDCEAGQPDEPLPGRAGARFGPRPDPAPRRCLMCWTRLAAWFVAGSDKTEVCAATTNEPSYDYSK
jgi:hypothetical protein